MAKIMKNITNWTLVEIRNQHENVPYRRILNNLSSVFEMKDPLDIFKGVLFVSGSLGFFVPSR